MFSYFRHNANLCKNSKLFNLGHNRDIFVIAGNYYSRRKDSNSKSPYKIVTANKFKGKNSKDSLTYENDPNWEIYGPKNNRFFLQTGNVGCAWLNNNTTIKGDVNLIELIDFDNNDKSKLGIKVSKCPLLIRKDLHELFPAPEVITEIDNLALITLSQQDHQCDHEKSAINFVLSAREISSKLRLHGYWADFLNPMSGRPFYAYSRKSLFKIDERFRGLCMKIERFDDGSCTSISEDQTNFSGNVFTNIAPNIEIIKSFIFDDE